MYKLTTAYNKISALNKRIRIIQGGTSASKTISVLIYLISVAQSNSNLTISIVSESLPHLRRGAIKDFINIMKTHNYYKDERWNKSEFTYRFETGSIIEFFSADQSAKLRGGRRDILFINECNNIDFNSYQELEVRTKLFIFLDFNPVAEFWVHSEIMPNFEHDFIKLTYKDNEALDPRIIQSIESRRVSNPNWWRVFGEGEVGINEGQIYTNWELIDEVPEQARLERYGLDFGYTNDPSACISIHYYNESYILNEEFYASSLSNRNIADLLKALPEALVIADSAEPKSIDEIMLLGVNIKGAEKGAGSVNQGIQLVQDQKLYVTKSSTNLIKDLRNYLWKVDKAGKALNVPSHEFSHSPDALRYGLTDLISRPSYTSNSFIAI